MTSLKTTSVPVDKPIQTKTSSILSSKDTLTEGFKESVSTIKQDQEALSKKMEVKEKSAMGTLNNTELKKKCQKCEPMNIEKEHPEAKAPESENAETKKNEIDTAKKTILENATTQTETAKYKMIPIVKKSEAGEPSNVAVPRSNPPLSTPLLNERPLVLATHLVPSLPIGLFEVLVEAIEVATEKPVVLLYEPRTDRPVAKEVTDIAILPASEEWEDGKLLPVSFCFGHRLNKDDSPCVYADIIVAADRGAHVEDITDLRGHRCSLPDRRKQIGAAALLFDHLYTKGENPTFFGNTLDANTQVATLQMVAGKQAEVGILEAPVIKCHKNSLPGVDSLHILTSLGPLPPYRFMAKKSLPDILVRRITAYLLNIDQDKEWVERFAPFGVTSFAENSAEYYHLSDMKSVVTSVPYY